MTTPTPFTVLQGEDDVACFDGVCAIPARAETDTGTADED